MTLLKHAHWPKLGGFSRQYVNEFVHDGFIQLVDVEQADDALASIRDHSQPLRRKHIPISYHYC